MPNFQPIDTFENLQAELDIMHRPNSAPNFAERCAARILSMTNDELLSTTRRIDALSQEDANELMDRLMDAAKMLEARTARVQLAVGRLVAVAEARGD